MHLGMAGPSKVPSKGQGSRPRRPPPDLYIGPWLRKLNLRQVDVANAAKIGQSHMSLIIKGERYPGPGTLLAIAEAMGLSTENLRKPPPDEKTIRAAADIDPAILARLSQNLPKS